MKITMIGHSSLLIETEDKRILTDPFFNRWGNPVFARIAAPAQSPEELKEVDLVLVSHDHWDHTDSEYFGMIGNKPVLAPRLSCGMLKVLGARNVRGVKAWEEIDICGIRITVVPAVHVTATVGFLLHIEGKQIYFAGDTYYHPFMQIIAQKFQLDAALMPVITFRIPMTMSEKTAVKAVQTLQPKTVIPIHLDIEPRLPLMRTRQSVKSFVERLHQSGSQTNVEFLNNGESYSI